jgi:hypothetical protein
MKLNRTAAVAGTAAVLAALGLGSAVTAAQADTNPPAPSVQTSDGDGEAEDGPDQGPDANPDQPGHQDTNQGPDANPNEPGHQDADESGETE